MNDNELVNILTPIVTDLAHAAEQLARQMEKSNLETERLLGVALQLNEAFSKKIKELK